MKRFLKRFIAIALFGATGAFLLISLIEQWEAIANLQTSVNIIILSVSIIAIIVIFFLDALGWHLILASLGANVPVASSIQVWLLSSLARYIPGGIWPYASRLTLCHHLGVPTAVVTLGLYLETLLLAASSLTIGLLAFTASTWRPFSLVSGILAALGIASLLHPRLLVLLNHIPGRAGRAFAHVTLPRASIMFLLYGYYLCFWLTFGSAFLLFARSFYPEALSVWIGLGASLALAFFVGFIAIFVPGGLGVRESTLYLSLQSFVPSPLSLLIALSSRLWIMFGEVASLVLVTFWLRRRH